MRHRIGLSFAAVVVSVLVLASAGCGGDQPSAPVTGAVPEAPAKATPTATSGTPAEVTGTVEPAATPTNITTSPGRTPEAGATPTPTGAPAAEDGWTTAVAVGTTVGQAADPTMVLLRDGSMASLEEVADGKPLLLYFFATW